MTGDRDMYQCASDRVTVLYVPHRAPGRRAGGPGRGEEALRRDARAGARLHRPARRPVRRDPGRQGHRREDRGRAAESPRLARGGDRRGDARDPPARARGPARAGRRAAPLQGHRHAARRRRQAPAGLADRLRRPPRRPRERGINRLAERLEGWPAEEAGQPGRAPIEFLAVRRTTRRPASCRARSRSRSRSKAARVRWYSKPSISTTSPWRRPVEVHLHALDAALTMGLGRPPSLHISRKRRSSSERVNDGSCSEPRSCARIPSTRAFPAAVRQRP